jgi:hypothetical protein
MPANSRVEQQLTHGGYIHRHITTTSADPRLYQRDAPGAIIVTIVLRFRDYTVALTISDAFVTSFKQGETLITARARVDTMSLAL